MLSDDQDYDASTKLQDYEAHLQAIDYIKLDYFPPDYDPIQYNVNSF